MPHNLPRKYLYPNSLLDPDALKRFEHAFAHQYAREYLSRHNPRSSNQGLYPRGLKEFFASHSPTFLPISDSISKRGCTPSTSSTCAGLWEGRQGGNPVRVKISHPYPVNTSCKIERYLFQEIVIWRRLFHPKVLLIPGVSPCVFSLCVVTEWTTSISDFTSRNPEVNCLCLLAEAARGLLYLHSMGIIHGNLEHENIVIGRNSHPRLIENGFLVPVGACLRTQIPTEEGDILAFGLVIFQVLAEQHHPLEAGGTIAGAITMARSVVPQDPNGLLSDDVWNFICGCLSPFGGSRHDPGTAIKILDKAGDGAEPRSGGIEEVDLISFLEDCKDGGNGNWDAKKVEAERIADDLSLALEDGGLHKRKRKQCQKYLRRVCSIFGVLPRSFILEPTFDERETEPFAMGGFSEVYRATMNTCPVAIKTLKVPAVAQKKVHKLLAAEVIGWRWLRHDNILPFLGVMLEPPRFSIVSERMENGNIVDFIQDHPDHNRLQLLLGVANGLEYLHNHDIIHGDLKGANVLIDSNHCARLADFGLATVIDESTAGSTPNNRGMRGTLRWMAPEMMYPEKFGFTNQPRRQLPSRSTDIYALGMTILEVITGSPPYSYIPAGPAVMYKVLEGVRPRRPLSGFSNQLWELLETTWLTERASEPLKRPQISTIIDRLDNDAHDWGKTIVPPAPVRKGESAEGLASDQSEGAAAATFGSGSITTHTRHSNPPSQADSGRVGYCGLIGTWTVDRLRWFFGLGSFGKLVRFLVGP